MCNFLTGFILLFGVSFTHLAAGLTFPGNSPGPAKSSNRGNIWTLENSAISASWAIQNGQLRPSELVNHLNGQALPQHDRELFRFSVGTGAGTPADEAQTWLGIKWSGDNFLIQTSTNGRGWRTISSLPRAGFTGSPTLLRVGKMDKNGGLSDYADAGETGTPRFDHLDVHGKTQAVFADDFTAPAMVNSWKKMRSKAPGTELAVREGWLTVTAPANCAAFLERPLSGDANQVTCQVDVANDQAQSWGPGLAIVWPDGKALVVNIRKEGTCSVISNGEEQIVGNPFQHVPDYNLAASRFKVFEGPKLMDLQPEPHNPRAGSHLQGKAIMAKLRDPQTGIHVMWRAVLRDGSNYIREEITLMTSSSQVTLSGIQLLDRQAPSATKLGSVPGSPVIAGDWFFGAEIPVFSSEIGTDEFTCGFPCTYRLEGKQAVSFSAVSGVVPEGQLRRGFQYYLERERARPARQYLHFNGWYDTGTGVSEKRLLEVIDAYNRELITKRRVKLDGFVIDDGWDDARNSFWGWKKSALPNGLEKARAAAEAAHSRLGIWISPLGGYGEAPMRIANARKLGVTDGDKLDLSDPRYYNWFRDKCLDLMKTDHVGYFKWDKAGDGVNPHFMSLLKIADELHAADPSLFLNVTVGTWPSPFWLNHVDCTWRDGADIGWIGKGDKREQWLTFRDATTYKNVVKRGPLYPLNSIMLHGIALGHHFQGKTVAEAGNHLRNDCRSFFATGTCMQEIYLSPDLMDDAAWDDLAETSAWARQHAEVLVDSHMIGGNPEKLEPYGWASWVPGEAVVALRNPDDVPKSITLEAREIFELPKGVAASYSLKSAYKEQRVQSLDLEVGKPLTVELMPFEVLVFDSH